MNGKRDLLLVFGTVQRVMRAEKAALRAGLDVDVIPAPRSVSSECGTVLEASSDQSDRLVSIEPAPQHVYRLVDGAWMPASLESSSSSGAALTRGSAYGGCGAKLARGTLSTILCGLPRVESDDLLVGIEFADDAGVVKVSPEQAIIHTADFFPPMVDDPFSFGRIAAVNALSDIFAMGGTVLAGINLISFPAADHGKDVLKEILRGGLDALHEAGGLLAGGHTIEGNDLLYGMAVTGTVHPDRIWRNGGALPGDALVLTKPLGTGMITTAAKAGMADPNDLSTAVRWMSTLNRDAAEEALRAGPHAVTDVTGFGLAGHAAEMADASALTIEIGLDSIPLLPGALKAASIGMVPAGAGKNRESLHETMKVDEGADQLLVDMTLDPQTSGGLLVACDPGAAARMAARLPGSAVIGRCVAGQAGAIRLRRSCKP